MVVELTLLTELLERLGLTYGAAGASRLNTLVLVGVVIALGMNLEEFDKDFYLWC